MTGPVAKLADARGLNPRAARRVGSIPTRTTTLPCARPGCKGTTRDGGKFCSAKYAAKSGWGKVNGHGRKPAAKASQQPATTSWWLSGDFYANARKRFPLDAPDANRSKVYTYGTETAGFSARAKAARQREGRTT